MDRFWIYLGSKIKKVYYFTEKGRASTLSLDIRNTMQVPNTPLPEFALDVPYEGRTALRRVLSCLALSCWASHKSWWMLLSRHLSGHMVIVVSLSLKWEAWHCWRLINLCQMNEWERLMRLCTGGVYIRLWASHQSWSIWWELPKAWDPSGGFLLITSGVLKKNDQNILNGNDLENGKGLTNWKMKIVTSEATTLA